MSLICSRCSNHYEVEGPCPRCGATYHTPDLDSTPPSLGPRWQQTIWGRLVIGLILAQGLFYGLRHLLIGVLLATSEQERLGDNVSHQFLLHLFQLIGVAVGAALAGGAQRSALVIGACVGAFNGMLAFGLRQNPAQGAHLLELGGHLLLQAAVGAVSGWVGALIWAPIPRTAVPAVLAQRKVAPRPRQPLFAGKIAWIRVTLGTAFGVAGTLSANLLLTKMVDVSGGRLGTTHEMQDLVITWEIKALAVLAGAALAGATTSNGLKQGLIVGLASSLILIVAQTPLPGMFFQFMVLTIISTMSLALVGGWFGGQLFPPVIKLRRRGMDGPSW